jgi:RhtB (resistance to homoserine/threonine) family protein
MSDLNFWVLFLSTAIALNIAPGPDLLFIFGKTISGGKKVGIAASLGVCSGALFHVVIAAVGLSAILVTSAIAFTVVKIIGVTYLLYLAYQAFKSTGITFEVNKDDNTNQTGSKSAWKAFKQGVLIDILNPKVAIFFMAFLPQFLREGHGSNSSQLLQLGFIVILVAIVVEIIFVFFASMVSHKFRENKQYSLWLDRVVGTIFVGLGVKLAVSSST